MLPYTVILEKIKKLSEIYDDPKLGSQSVEAQNIRNALKQEKSAEIEKAIRSATMKAKTKQLRDVVFPAIKADMAVALNQAAQQTKTATPAQPTQPAAQTPAQPTQPATPAPAQPAAPAQTAQPAQPKKSKTPPKNPIKIKRLTKAQKAELNKFRGVAKLTGIDLRDVNPDNYLATVAALKVAKKNFWLIYDKPDKHGDKKMTELTDEQKQQKAELEKYCADNGLKLPDGNDSNENYQSYYDKLKKIVDEHKAGKTDQTTAGKNKKAKDGAESETDTSGKNKENTEGKNAPDNNEELKVSTLNGTPAPTNEEQPKDWVDKKIAHYKALAEAGKITGFDYDKENKTEFIAYFNNATIHYTSEDSVQVSENANISVYETILQEPSNKNRTVNFAENMPHDAAMHLKAACLLNGNAMTGTQPEFTADDLQKLSQELGEERFKELQDKIREASNQPKTEENQPKTEENTENKQPKSDRVISNAEELGKDAERLREIKKKFEGLKEFGWIAVVTDENGKPDIAPGRQFSDPESDEAKAMVKAAKQLFNEAAEIVKSNKSFKSEFVKDGEGIKSSLNDQQKADLVTFNEERLQHLRNDMDKEALKKHDEKADKVALIHAKRMGLKEVENIKVTRMVKEGDQFVEKEVKTIENEAQRNAYKEEHAKSPEFNERIAKIIQQQNQTVK